MSNTQSTDPKAPNYVDTNKNHGSQDSRTQEQKNADASRTPAQKAEDERNAR